MRYLVSSLLVLPLLLSCTVTQDEYSNPGYYAPPPPRVEVNPGHHRNETRHYHGHNEQRPVSRGKVYHGHEEADDSSQVEVQENVHGHENTNKTVHGHSGNTRQVRAKVHGRG